MTELILPQNDTVIANAVKQSPRLLRRGACAEHMRSAPRNDMILKWSKICVNKEAVQERSCTAYVVVTNNLI